MFCRGDGGGIALMIACIGGGGGIGIVFVILDIGVDGGGDGGGGGDENILVVLCVGGGGGGGVGILGISANFVDDDGTLLSPSRTDSVASANGDGGGGGGGIKDADTEIDLLFENPSDDNEGDNVVGYGARSSLSVFA